MKFIERYLRATLFIVCASSFPGATASASSSQNSLPVIENPYPQPLIVYVDRVRQAMDYLGSPFPDAVKTMLDSAKNQEDGEVAVRLFQQALDPFCLVGVNINPESRVKVVPGPATKALVRNGWRNFLVKVHNQAGVTGNLSVSSPQAVSNPDSEDRDRWLRIQTYNGRPVWRNLSGLELEYRIIQLHSRDAGKRAAVIAFDVGQGSQDLGFRSEVPLTFDVLPTTPLSLQVLDEEGKPTTAGFEIRDSEGRTYPSQTDRQAPDFAFHPQVYRASGATIELPAGTYTVDCGRGPEYLKQSQSVTMSSEPQSLTFNLERWIDPSREGWWSGDHHIHAAGCAHYANPARGVRPEDMLLHTLGEDLKVGATLTWGPGFDYQKRFFTGLVDTSSEYPYLIRYDVEVSGFGSHRSGHLCLLQLEEQIYPGGDSKHHWPTLGLNTLKWAKKQGAVVGPAHSGWGLDLETDDLPNYKVPPYSGIGANEYIVDVTHMVPGPDGSDVPAVDFLSMCDTPPSWELNMWYHTLNVGFRTRVSGETDFPCIFGERVGIGRSYVQIDGALDYGAWCEGIRQGRNYVSDGLSHIVDFKVNDAAMGIESSELRLGNGQTVRATARVAAFLPEEPIERTGRELYWDLEKARVDSTRDVKIELIVNGYPVEEAVISADGTEREVDFQTQIDRSSWVALRIFPSSHTNPIFVIVDDKPIRASQRSAQWCLEGVDQCWSQKERFIAEDEMEEAILAYDHARETYRRILEESEVE